MVVRKESERQSYLFKMVQASNYRGVTVTRISARKHDKRREQDKQHNDYQHLYQRQRSHPTV